MKVSGILLAQGREGNVEMEMMGMEVVGMYCG